MLSINVLHKTSARTVHLMSFMKFLQQVLLHTKSFLFASLVAVLVSGCVSSIDQSGAKVDKQQALEAHVRLGMSYLQKRDRDRALRAFNEAQKLDSRSAEAMQGIALVHQLNGEVDQADEKFKKALKLKPAFERSNIEMSYAQFLYDNGRCSDALPFLKKARSDISYPNRTRALYMLGLCLKNDGDQLAAKGAFDHALNLNSRYAAAAIELSELALEAREYSEAKQYLDIYYANARQRNARSLLLGIRIERIFGNKDKEASYALALKNLHPYSQEYLEYKSISK